MYSSLVWVSLNTQTKFRRFHFEDLVLQCSLAKTKIFNENYSNQVKLLHLYSVPKDIDEIFLIIPKCLRLRRLCLQFGQNHVKSK